MLTQLRPDLVIRISTPAIRTRRQDVSSNTLEVPDPAVCQQGVDDAVEAGNTTRSGAEDVGERI
jgi:hypothetical protein